jgi:DNA-binding winged helix-turn-helix (wHTH) protein/class 3 adenylate cyclase/predicted ATPase
MRYRFGDCVLDTVLYALERQGQTVRLSRRVFQVLEYLLAQRHRVVSRDELFAEIWGEQFVSDAALEGCIKQVRQAVGDSGRAQRCIRTQHGYGYRFVAEVTAEAAAGPATLDVEALPHGTDLPRSPPEYVSDAAHTAVVADTCAVPPAAATPAAAPLQGPEHRQLTVLSCALADAAALSARLNPDDLHDVVHAFHTCCAAVVHQVDGSVAQRTADGLLVYFGYPQAHDDDARRAVHAGLRLVETLRTLVVPGAMAEGGALVVRIGIHTGPVVLSPPASDETQPPLAVGAVALVAAGLRDRAAPQTVVISATTAALAAGYFTWRPLDLWTPPGHEEPIAVYRVTGETGARMRLDLAAPARLTPFVGREPELALLRERWVRAQEGRGQVVVLRGEAGIGKSRLVRQAAEWLTGEACTMLESRGSPYAQHTAFAPVRELVQQVVGDDVARLEAGLQHYNLELQAHLPFLAALLNLSVPADRYPHLPLTPQQQRRRLLETLVTLPVALADRQPVLLMLEDLHWVDPSTLAWLGLLLDQVPTSRVLVVLTCRPEFHAPWSARSYLVQMTLGRLRPQHSAQLAAHVARGALPEAVVAQVVERTDGVPLFIEELTRALRDAGGLPGAPAFPARQGRPPAAAIPATLQETLTARLDQMGEAKRTAQVGAVIGRQFSSALLRAVSPLDEATLRQDLRRLVDSELLYQRGSLPQAAFTFKHALIQEVAYQSLLRSTRQQHHAHIAEVLETQFADLTATQPELLAHHYTAAGRHAQAMPYWQRAGEQAAQRSAHAEAIAHLTQGLAVLQELSDTKTRAHQELALQRSLGTSLLTRGFGLPEVGVTYSRARDLCEQLGETDELFPVLFGLWGFHHLRLEWQDAREVAQQLLTLAAQQSDTGPRLIAHRVMGDTLYWLGEFVAARAHLEQGIALYDAEQHRAYAYRYGQDPLMGCQANMAWTLWELGYPDQALQRMEAAVAWAQHLAHPFSLAYALNFAMLLQGRRRAWHAELDLADQLEQLGNEQGFAQWTAQAVRARGRAMIMLGRQEGMDHVVQGEAAARATGTRPRTGTLSSLATRYHRMGQTAEALRLAREALALAEATGEHVLLAELHRLPGEFLLALSETNHPEATACFLQALDIARSQQAKFWELRAATSLARLWQHQDKRQEAYDLLAPVYDWFTEGFDTADLREAKALVQALTP